MHQKTAITIAALFAAVACAMSQQSCQTQQQTTDDISSFHHLTDDAGWCWFQDPRALILGDTLIFGSVASGRTASGDIDETQKGNVELTLVDLKTPASHHTGFSTQTFRRTITTSRTVATSRWPHPCALQSPWQRHAPFLPAIKTSRPHHVG